MIDAAVTGYGGLDVLVNNAGFTHRSGPAWELDEADYDRVVGHESLTIRLTARSGDR